MSQFKRHIDAYLRGEINFATLAEHLSLVITRDPDKTESTRQTIRAAEQTGLPKPVSKALQNLLPGGAGSSAGNRGRRPAERRFPPRGPVPNRPGGGRRNDLSPTAGKSQEEPTQFNVGAAARSRQRGARAGGPVAGPSGTADATDHNPDTAPTTEHVGPGAALLWSQVRSSRSRFLFAEAEANQPTETGRPEKAPGQEAQFTIGPGFVLKDRFELQQPLGEGGMGVVYRALDRLKVEAGDRNPFLAIKLLASDFRYQRGSFIALQREASKAQRLAHPNIATVYDFDRDGDTIFMTMELLEGQPLSRVIRNARPDGLSVDKAMQIIEQLAAGLSYAHKHQLVHSDLKPGNCFLTDDGRVKLLDFGIARASKTHQDAEGDGTLFDPMDLGALTPAYATVEMFDGEPPDPRDDIYALACISYELVAGHHPFDKTAAPRAKVKNLKPKRLPGLTRRQFRGLRHALAFDRQERTPNVEQFLKEISAKRSRAMPIAIAATAGLTLVGAVAYQPVENYLLEQRSNRLVTRINQGQEAEVLAAVAALPDLDPRSRDVVLDATRQTIIELYEQRAHRTFDIARKRYDYPSAEQEMRAATRLFPDSARVLLASSALRAARDEFVKSLEDRYSSYLDEGKLLSVNDEEDIIDVLDLLKQVAPEHPLLDSRRLPLRYAQEVEKAMARGDMAQAEALLQASAANTVGSPILDSLQERMATGLTASGALHQGAQAPSP